MRVEDAIVWEAKVAQHLVSVIYCVASEGTDCVRNDGELAARVNEVEAASIAVERCPDDLPEVVYAIQESARRAGGVEGDIFAARIEKAVLVSGAVFIAPDDLPEVVEAKAEKSGASGLGAWHIDIDETVAERVG